MQLEHEAQRDVILALCEGLPSADAIALRGLLGGEAASGGADYSGLLMLDTLFGARGSNAPAPLPSTVVDALVCRAAGLGDGDCVVCLEPSVPAQPVTELPCAHVFHAACIKKWLSTSGACPVCRLVL